MSPNVLVVDDSLTVRANLQHALTAAGFSVTACENGALARKALRSGPYALIILDVLLPDANGIEIAQEARAFPPTAKAPIIMLSSESDVQHRIRGLNAGATDYIGKPYGASFVVKRARQLTEARGAAASPGPLRILLVDDSPTFLNAFADRLRMEGHDVILAKSGSEALSFLAVQPVDGVVLDVFMPGISGLETCRRIKSTPAWADIPVMMLTGREDSVAKATGLTAGVDEYVVKSTDVAAMSSRLGELLRRKRIERGVAKQAIPRAPESTREGSRFGALTDKPPASRSPESPRDSVRIAAMTEKPPSSKGPDSPRAADWSAAARGPDSTRDPSRLAAFLERAASPKSPDSQREVARTPTPPLAQVIEPSRGPESSREPESRTSPLFEQVLSVCGLPHFIGRSSLKRAFERAGVDVGTLTCEGIERAIGDVRQTLAVFLPAAEAEKHAAAVATLVRKLS
jgi:DNA-binding response OmpR family regulator